MISFVASVSLAITVLAGNDTTATVDLGGLRQVKANLTISESDYLIKLRMLAVQCFDPTTNATLNREKGRQLALQALARYLSDRPAAQLTVSGARVENTSGDGKVYSLTLRVPRRGVVLVQEGTKPPEKPVPNDKASDQVVFSSSLFTARRDYLNTLEQLAINCLADLQRVERAVGKAKKTEPAFFQNIAELEERALANLDRFAAAVKDERLLLTVEKEELSAALSREKDRLLNAMRAVVRKREQQSKDKNP